MRYDEKVALKELIREVIREELDARRITRAMPWNSKRVMAETGWSYSKVKRLKDTLGGWKNQGGELMFHPDAILDYMKSTASPAAV